MSLKRTSIAKINAPRLFDSVPRERLFAWLDANRGRALIWIEGPPGAGKTTLGASYLEARRVPALWYQVDPGDADPATLFHYLTIAVAATTDGEVPILPRLAAEHLADLPAFARTYFRELFAFLPQGVVLVLDNVQEVPADAALHAIVRAAASEVPPGSSIVAISREQAPGMFSPLVAQGALVNLRWDALRLTLEETRAVSAARSVRDDWLVRALHHQSEGWAAGVTLMLERLGHTAADSGVLSTDTREAVFDYFANLLFEQATPETRHTLLSVAFSPHLTASMAQRLSGNGRAEALLVDLHRRHLFTDRRPGPEPVYQFHALFRDFLQRRARDSLPAVEVSDVMVRTADMQMEAGNVDAAMDLLVSAQAWEKAVPAILREAQSTLRSARWQTLERWIGALPPEMESRHPTLTYWLGMAQSAVDPAQGLATLDKARKLLLDTADRDGRIRCLAALLHTAHVGHAAIKDAGDWVDELLALLEEPDLKLPRETELTVCSALVGTLQYLRPWHPLVRSARHRVQELLLVTDDVTLALAAATTALVSDVTTGNLAASDEIVRQMEPVAMRADSSPSTRAWFLYGVAYLRFMQTRYEESLEYFDAAIAAASLSGPNETLSDITLYRVMVEFRVHGWAVAGVTLAKGEANFNSKRPGSLALLRIYQARREHFHDRWDEAAALVVQCREAIEQAGLPQWQMSFGLFIAEVLAGAGKFDEARATLKQSREWFDRSPPFGVWRAGVEFCETFLALCQHGPEAALVPLRRALASAREGDRKLYLRYFECGMPPLFSLALEHGIEVDLVKQLIGMFRLKAPADAPDSWPRRVRIRTLGRFEVLVGDEPLEFSRKVPKKTLALLKALIAYRGAAVPEQWLCDALWGDEEADAARQVLGVTVARLRKLLCSDEAVVQQGGKVWLDRSICWVDAWRFESLIGDARGDDLARDGLAMYGGEFLPDDEAESWTVPARERLRGRFIHALAARGEQLEASGNLEEAASLYLRGIDADGIVESFHRGLMHCYRRQGRLAEAVSAYRRLRQTLSVVLGVAPSAESLALYEEIMKQMAAIGTCGDDSAIPNASAFSMLRQPRTVTSRKR